MDQLSPATRPNVPHRPRRVPLGRRAPARRLRRRAASSTPSCSTGVYCRPGCAGPPAAAGENVAFHATAGEAERAGFRPCKRCRPNEPSRAERHAEAVADACRRIEAAIERGDAGPTLAALARSAGMSVFHFHRVFQAVAGVTPRGLRRRPSGRAAARAASRRRKRHGGGLRRGLLLLRPFLRGRRVPPRHAPERLSRRRRRGRDPLRGRRVLARLGAGRRDGQGRLRHRLRGRPRGAGRGPSGPLPEGDPDRGRRAASRPRSPRSSRPSRSPARGLDLPLDVRGTAFQAAVWRALREIPAGETASYAAIAERIGRPGAVRAVAQACAANPGRAGDPLPPRGAPRRRARRLPLGRRAQARAPGPRGARPRPRRSGMSAVAARPRMPPPGSRRPRWASAWRRSPGTGSGPISTLTAAPSPARCSRRRMRRPRRALRLRRGFPQPDRHGPARVWARRVQVLRGPAAGPGGALAGRALPAPRPGREPLGRALARARALPRRPRRLPAALPRRRSDPADARCCCATRPATTTACTRTSTAPTSSRSRSRSCSPSPGAISRAASSC